MQVEVQSKRIEQVIDHDPYASAEWLRTTICDGVVTESVRYTDDDVSKYGFSQVSQWVEQDHERLEAFDKGEWSFLHLQVKLIGAVWTETKELDECTVATACVGGVESDAPQEHLDQLFEELMHEVKAEAYLLGLEPTDNLEVRMLQSQ